MNGDDSERLRQLRRSPGYWVSLVVFALIIVLVAAFFAVDPDRTELQYGLSRAVFSLGIAGLAAFIAFWLLHLRPASLRPVVVLGLAVVVFLVTFLALPFVAS